MGYQPRHAFGNVKRVIGRLSWPVRVSSAFGITAGAVVLGTALMPAAQGSTSPPTVTTKAFAGGQAFGNGWNYRYVAETATLPDINSPTWQHAIPAGYGVSVRLQNAAETVDLGISTLPSGGPYNAAVAVEHSDGTTYGFIRSDSPPVQANDTVRLSLYRNYTGFNTTGPVGQIDYAVMDLTNPADSFSGHFMDTSGAFDTARYGDGFAANDYQFPGTPMALVNGNARLNRIDNVTVTNRTGVHGAAGLAPWPVQSLKVTTTGGSSTTLASVPFFWGGTNNADNFSIWFPSAP